MIQFAHIEILFGLVLIPLLIIVFHLGRAVVKRKLRRFASESLHLALFPDASIFKSAYKFYLSVTALCLLIIALAGPRVGSKLKEVEKKGREIIIALDVSNSMLAEDIAPNRLERAKQSVSRLIDKLEDDKLGLIVFAGDAYTQIPLTSDYSSAKMFLESINTEIVSKQGTNIAAAIDLALKSFSPVMDDQAPSSSRAIIIITDGENHEQGVFDAAERAKEKGVQVHCVGLGNSSGVPIPIFPGSKEFRKDRQGNVVVSKLDDKTLKRITEITGGIYVHSGSSISGLFTLMEKLNQLDKQEYKSRVFAEYDERFQYFVGFAMLLLLMDFFVSYRKNTWFSRFRLFEE
ncbi:MAG: VWA domain-containing protein [Spirochaetales bacterium]|nr:VWA domain-containing protein [Spirochaetales bacterium]